MAASFIAAGSVSNAASCAITGTITASDVLLACISIWHSGGTTISGVSDGTNGAYSFLGRSSSGGNMNVEFWGVISAGMSNPTATVTATNGSGNSYANFLLQLRGVTSLTARDFGTAATLNTATDANVTTAGSAAVTGDIVIAQAVAGASGSTNMHFAATQTGYTNAGVYQNWDANTTQSVDYKVLGTGGSQSAQFDHDSTAGGATNGWAANILVLNGGGGGGGGSTIIPPRQGLYRLQGFNPGRQ